MRGPFRHRWFAIFVGANGLGALGESVRYLVLPLLVLEMTHSIGVAAGLRVAQFLPYVLFGAFAGVLIDRFDKQRMLILSDAVSIVLTVLIPLSAWLGMLSIELIFIVAFLMGITHLFWRLTAEFSVVPALVEPHELTAANAAFQVAERIAEIAGPVVAGVAFAAFGGANAMWIGAIAFVPTLLVFARMPPIYEVQAIARARLTVSSLGSEMGEGFRFIRESMMLRALLLLVFATNLGNAGVSTVLLFVLAEEFRLDPLTIGFALGLSGVVQVSGSVFAPWIARRHLLGRSMLGAVTVMGVGALFAAIARDWRLIVAAVCARETARAAHYVYTYIPRQREIPAELRGRVNGSFRAVIFVATAASPALLSGVQSVAGSPAAFATAGGLGLVGAALTFFSPLRDYDIRAEPEVRS